MNNLSHFIDDDGYIFSDEEQADEKKQNYISIKNECFINGIAFTFYKYNPFDIPTIPLFAHGCLVDINKRALKILKIETLEELNSIMLRFRNVQIQVSNFIAATGDDDYAAWLLTDVASLIFGYIDNEWAFEYQEIFQDNKTLQETKPRIFALLAIFLIGSICNSEIDVNKTRGNHYLAVKSMEAICVAEKYVTLSEKAKKAANIRHAPMNKIKAKVINGWYQNSHLMSKNQYAQMVSTKMNLNYDTVRKWLKGLINQLDDDYKSDQEELINLFKTMESSKKFPKFNNNISLDDDSLDIPF